MSKSPNVDLNKRVPAYRVQDADGRGPWKPGFSKVWVQDRTDDEFAALAPIAEQFPDLVFPSGYHFGCGCETVDQLKLWFNVEEFRILRSHGYHAVSLKVDRMIARSDVQCVFGRRLALNRKVRKFALYGR